MNSKYTRIPKQTKNSTMDNSTCFIMDLLSLQYVSVCFYLGVLGYCEKQIFCLTSAQKDIAKSAIPSFDSLYAIIKLKKIIMCSLKEKSLTVHPYIKLIY